MSSNDTNTESHPHEPIKFMTVYWTTSVTAGCVGVRNMVSHEFKIRWSN